MSDASVAHPIYRDHVTGLLRWPRPDHSAWFPPGFRNASHWLTSEAATRAIWTRVRWVAPRVPRAADAAPVGGRSLVHERRGDQRVGRVTTTCDGGLSRSAPARACAAG